MCKGPEAGSSLVGVLQEAGMFAASGREHRRQVLPDLISLKELIFDGMCKSLPSLNATVKGC